MSDDALKVIRELMCAVECLRQVCEHTVTDDEVGAEALVRGMRLGIRVNDQFAGLLPDYQKLSFWEDVAAVWGDAEVGRGFGFGVRTEDAEGTEG